MWHRNGGNNETGSGHGSLKIGAEGHDWSGLTNQSVDDDDDNDDDG